MQKELYTFSSDSQFQVKYNSYKKFMETNNRSIIPAGEVVACSFASRVNKVRTNFDANSSPKNKFLLARFMIDSATIGADELTILDNIMIKSKIK
jgi:hypothetical protein